MKMKIHDISIEIKEGMLTFPSDPSFEREKFCSIADGAGADVEIYKFGSHTGTHVDSKKHMYGEGQTTDEIPLSRLVGEARVVDLRGKTVINAEALAKISLEGIKRVLFKTDNSEKIAFSNEFDKSFVGMDNSGAEVLVKAGVEVVGIDYLSIDAFGAEGAPAHKTLIPAGITILEGINLSEVEEGVYTMFMGVVKIKRSDGAPARVLLIEN